MNVIGTLLKKAAKVTNSNSEENQDVVRLGKRKWKSIPTIRIIQFESKKNEDNKTVVVCFTRVSIRKVYQLEVKDGLEVWNIQRRYSEFLSLDDRVIRTHN
jgi:hypothetical protein